VFALEDASVQDAKRTLSLAIRMGKPWLGYMDLDWERLFKSADPPGAEAAPNAQRLTRRSKQRSWQAHREQRKQEFLALVHAVRLE